MGIKGWLLDKQKELSDKIMDAKVESEIIRAKKLRKKMKRINEMEPGARRTILEGLNTHKNVLDVMKDEYKRRKEVRDEKYGK